MKQVAQDLIEVKICESESYSDEEKDKEDEKNEKNERKKSIMKRGKKRIQN